MTVLREVLARFGIEVDDKKLGGMTSGVDQAIGSLKTLGAVLAGGAVVGALTHFVNEMAEVGGELTDTSAVLGINTTALQEWRYAAKLVGIDAGELSGAMVILNRNLDGAAQGGKGQADVFRRLGVSIKDAQGNTRGLEALLPEIAEGFSKIENPADRAGVASGLFGRSGAKLLPLLTQGAAGVEELRKEFEKLGGGATPEMIAAADEFGDEMDKLDTSLFSIKARIAGSILPSFTAVVDLLNDVSGAVSNMIKKSNIATVALGVLGAAALGFGVKFLAGFAVPIATAAVFALGIGFIILLLDDLITLFAGGKSVIGGFIDEMFGLGTAQGLVLGLTDSWEGLILMISDAKWALKDFLGMDTSADEKPWWAKQNIIDAGEISRGQDRGAALAGRMTINKGETREQARARFLETRKAAIGTGEINATRSDVESGIARRVGRTRPRTLAIPGREPGLEAGGKKVAQANTVSNSTSVVIQVPPGSERSLLTNIERSVTKVLTDRDRATAAALAQEAVPEEEG